MKKKLFALGAAAVLALGLASCGGEVDSNVIELEYSGTASNKTFNMSLFEDFKAARKAAGDTHTYNISYVEHGADAVDSEVQDWVVGPDVFEFASDKITNLYQKGALARISGQNATYITENNNTLAQGLAKFNGEYYAYPFSSDNTYYVQYDTSFFTADDVKSIETMLEKAAAAGKKVGYELETPFWGAGALCTFGADYQMTFTEDGTVNTIEANFDSESGIKAGKAIYKIMKHPAWQNGMDVPTPSNGLVACIAGTWKIADYREALGQNYGCAPMPTVTIDGDTKPLGAFLGGKLFGVNPQRSQGDVDRLAAAHQLALFLSNKDCQFKRFEDQKVIPCNLEAAAIDKIAKYENTKVLALHSPFTRLQSATPPRLWSAPGTFVAAIKAGDCGSGEEADLEKLKTAMQVLNQSIKDSK